jgi:hypothetical protein
VRLSHSPQRDLPGDVADGKPPCSNSYRTTSEEMREKERLLMQEDENSPHNYNAIRRAAEVHRQVRQYARAHIKPGMQMTDIADMIENGTRALVEENGMKSGIGFPTGLSRNHCAAHWTPNAGDKTGEARIREDQRRSEFSRWTATDFGAYKLRSLLLQSFKRRMS